MKNIFYILGIMFFLVELNIVDIVDKYYLLIPIAFYYFFKYLFIFNYKLLSKQSVAQQALNQSDTYQATKAMVKTNANNAIDSYQSRLDKAMKKRDKPDV